MSLSDSFKIGTNKKIFYPFTSFICPFYVLFPELIKRTCHLQQTLSIHDIFNKTFLVFMVMRLLIMMPIDVANCLLDQLA